VPDRPRLILVAWKEHIMSDSSKKLDRRGFLKGSVLAGAAGGAMAAGALRVDEVRAADATASEDVPAGVPCSKFTLPCGKIGNLQISRMLLGGNLLTHYTHSRDLKYVYNLAAHYNTVKKIRETLATAEEHGINTLSVHNPPGIVEILQAHRKAGGKIKWIICPTAGITDDMKGYTEMVAQLADAGTDAFYVWGVRSDPLSAKGKKGAELIAKAVEAGKMHGVPSGVGCHDLNAVKLCEAEGVNPDFYIKTFHHHKYPTGPKPEEIKGPYSEFPGYWCSCPDETAKVMSAVKKPWIAFKIMAAGAIPPANAFGWAFNNGADHILVGMFDYEIAEDAKIGAKAVEGAKNRTCRPWCS